MPHQQQDLLLPGESLRPGEFLLSSDNRFRLYLEEDGALVAFAYRPDKMFRFWRSISAGPNAVAELGRVRYPRQSSDAPALLLKNQNGGVVWYASDQTFSAPAWGNHFFAMQSDGNIVHYAKASTTGLTKATWSSGTYDRWNNEIAIPPNTPIVEVPSPGTVLIQTNVGDGDIINNSGAFAAAYSGATVIGLPNGARCSFTLPGTLNFSNHFFEYLDLRAPDGAPATEKAGDGLPVPRPNSGERRTIEITTGGRLRLRGLFTNPELKALGEVIISGGRVVLEHDGSQKQCDA